MHLWGVDGHHQARYLHLQARRHALNRLLRPIRSAYSRFSHQHGSVWQSRSRHAAQRGHASVIAAMPCYMLHVPCPVLHAMAA